MCFTNVNEAGKRYRYFMYSTNKCTDFNKNITLYKKKKKKKKSFVGSIYGRSSLKSAHFVMIHYQTWPPQTILVSDWPIFKNLLLGNRLAK